MSAGDIARRRGLQERAPRPRLLLPRRIGYARVSTTDQDLAIQHTALTASGCEVIRAEKVSGTRRNSRTECKSARHDVTSLSCCREYSSA